MYEVHSQYLHMLPWVWMKTIWTPRLGPSRHAPPTFSARSTPAKNKTRQEKHTTHTLRQARASRPDSLPRPLAPRLTAARSNSRLFGSAMVDTLCEVGGREQVGWACLPCALPSEKATPQLGAPRFRPLLVSRPAASCRTPDAPHRHIHICLRVPPGPSRLSRPWAALVAVAAA